MKQREQNVINALSEAVGSIVLFEAASCIKTGFHDVWPHEDKQVLPQLNRIQQELVNGSNISFKVYSPEVVSLYLQLRQRKEITAGGRVGSQYVLNLSDILDIVLSRIHLTVKYREAGVS